MGNKWKCPLCGVLIPVWIELDNGRRFSNTSEMDKHMKAHAKGEV